MADPVTLSPAQRAAYDQMVASLPMGSLFELRSSTGRGRTTVLKAVHAALGGAMLGVRDFALALEKRHPLALEETLLDQIHGALAEHQHVIVDDLHVLTATMGGNCSFYPRSGLLESPMNFLVTYAAETGKTLIVGSDGNVPASVAQRRYAFAIGKFGVEDYAHLCRAHLGEDRARGLEIAKVHRFAPNLNAHQLRGACGWFRRADSLSTDEFIEYLRSQRLASNVELAEVADVHLHDLKGVDDVIRSLEANIVLPLEHAELARELELQPKRGVLLAGPPGTGKTTVGRALAHRLKGKFFLVDGTFISGTRDFYNMIHRVFQEAKENAPSVIFIDDSDVIFESGHEHGLYRYLLTMLDGLESKSAARVCVMMTAMDVGNLPPALVRSGRVELWLEMRPPDPSARQAIMQQLIGTLPQAIRFDDVDDLVAATEGFTGADLKRMVEDGKVLYAFDVARNRPLKPIAEYFLSAVAAVGSNAKKYAEAEARARANRPPRPPWFDVYHDDFSTHDLED
ncbi:MAG: ATP-binding protein [Isosphaeraceae bacterium]